MSLLAPQPIVLPYLELPGAISARALSEHYKLYTGYRDMLQRVDQGLSTTPRPGAHEAESAYSGLLWGQSYALGGAYLHELYFGNLTANTLRPMILLGIEGLIERKWGSQEAFHEDFRAAALQARGWVVLAVCAWCPEDLRIFALDAHDLGAVYGYCPLLVIDTYEHAYWMDFGTERATYLQNIMGYVNWQEVDRRYNEVHPPAWKTTMSYDYDRRPLVAVSRPDAKGDPVKEAISDGWDKMHEFQESALDVALSLKSWQEAYDDPTVKAGEKMVKLLDRLEWQSRSWRSGFNFWLEGKNIDKPRLKGDLEKTVGMLQEAVKTLMIGAHETGEQQRAAKAAQGAHDAIRLFTHAMPGLK